MWFFVGLGGVMWGYVRFCEVRRSYVGLREVTYVGLGGVM